MKFREAAFPIRAVNEDERSVTHVISDESVDSHGSIIRLDGWDLGRFKKGALPVLGFHSGRSFPIGRPTDIHKDSKNKALVATTRFAGLDQMNSAAETAFRMVKDGFMKSWSVGFNPRKWKPREDISDEEKMLLWDPFEYIDQELMEYSLVPVPSNSNALNKARDAGIDIDPMVEWIAQQKELVDFCTEHGIQIPGVNDGIEVRSTDTWEFGFNGKAPLLKPKPEKIEAPKSIDTSEIVSPRLVSVDQVRAVAATDKLPKTAEKGDLAFCEEHLWKFDGSGWARLVEEREPVEEPAEDDDIPWDEIERFVIEEQSLSEDRC